MICNKCGKDYATYPEAKICYDSHTDDTIQVTEQKPTLSNLNNLLHKPSEPVKRIAPKQVAKDAEYTPRTNAQKLIGIAKDYDHNGHGVLTLHQARFELADKTLTIKDVIDLIIQYYPAVEIEQRPGNTLHLHFHTAKRTVKPAIDQLPPKHVS